eukprot:s1255_g11.t1
MGLAAIYCHPLEFFLSDLMPLGAGLVAVRTNGFTGVGTPAGRLARLEREEDLTVSVVWMAFAVMATQTHHCGIRWPWIDLFSFQAEAQPNFHDFHHELSLHLWMDFEVASTQLLQRRLHRRAKQELSARMHF